MHMLESNKGEDHVSAQDQAYENMSIIGPDVYVMNYGNGLPLTMTTANKLTVGTGALLVNGRFCIIDPAESLTVDNGSSGMKENDLVCVHWTSSSGKESASLAIVKGTPKASGATDPTITNKVIKPGVTDAYVPFARIVKNGLTPTVSLIVPKITTEVEYRDYVSQTKTWGNSKVTFTRVGNIVICHGQVDVTIAAWSTVELCDIPNGYKPIAEAFAPAVARDYLNARVNATVAGKLTAMSLKNPIEGNIGIVFELVWITA